MSRRRALLLFPAIVVAVVAVAWLLLPRSTAISIENAARIREGMTLAEVERILGGPARDETVLSMVHNAPGDEIDGLELVQVPQADRPDSYYEWLSASAWVRINLKEDGRVDACLAMPVRAGSPISTVRRWLGL